MVAVNQRHEQPLGEFVKSHDHTDKRLQGMIGESETIFRIGKVRGGRTRNPLGMGVPVTEKMQPLGKKPVDVPLFLGTVGSEPEAGASIFRVRSGSSFDYDLAFLVRSEKLTACLGRQESALSIAREVREDRRSEDEILSLSTQGVMQRFYRSLHSGQSGFASHGEVKT